MPDQTPQPFPLYIADAVKSKGVLKGPLLVDVINRIVYLEKRNIVLDFENKNLKERNDTLHKAFKEVYGEHI